LKTFVKSTFSEQPPIRLFLHYLKMSCPIEQHVNWKFWIYNIGAKTINWTTFSVMTFSILDVIAALSKTFFSCLVSLSWLSLCWVAFCWVSLRCNARRHYAECHDSECRAATKWHTLSVREVSAFGSSRF